MNRSAERAPTPTPAPPPSSSPPPSPRAVPIPRASRRSFVSSAQAAKVSSREKQNRPRSGPCRARTPVGSRRAFRNGTEFPKRREGDRSSPRAAWPATTRARPRPPLRPRLGVETNAVTNATTRSTRSTRAPSRAEDARLRAARDAKPERFSPERFSTFLRFCLILARRLRVSVREAPSCAAPTRTEARSRACASRTARGSARS